jgi:hypothetical protein
MDRTESGQGSPCPRTCRRTTVHAVHDPVWSGPASMERQRLGMLHVDVDRGCCLLRAPARHVKVVGSEAGRTPIEPPISAYHRILEDLENVGYYLAIGSNLGIGSFENSDLI